MLTILRQRALCFQGDDEIEIEILSRREQNDEMACVSYDGDTTAELAVGDRFVISKAANHTKICKLHQRSFWRYSAKDGKLFITQIRIVIMNSYK